MIPASPPSTSGRAADRLRHPHCTLEDILVFRRIVIAVLSLLTVAVPCTEALAQDFVFPASSTYRLRGFLNSFNLKGQAATGAVSFDSAGSVTGGIITFNAFHPTQADTKLLTGGALTVAGRALLGQFLTGNRSTDMSVQGFTPTDDLFFLTSDDGSSEPNHLGLLVGVRQGGTFGMSDLVSSTWRFKALGAPSPGECCGAAEWALGSLTLDASGNVTGEFIEFPDGTAPAIPAVGDFAIDADGNVTGSFVADVAGSCGDSLPVDGFMSPDKTLMAAVIQLRCDGVPTGSALVIFQRDPSPMQFVPTDLTGTYDLVAVDHPVDALNGLGTRIRGNVTVTSGGVVSGVFMKPFGRQATLTGTVSMDGEGFVCATSEGCPASLTLTEPERLPTPLQLRAVMTADKRTIIGVSTSFEDGGTIPRVALFTLVRRPAAPVSTVRFSASMYSTSEGNTAATITVLRAGTTSSEVTVDYTTTDDEISDLATAGSDYSTTSGTLTFAAGVTTATFTVSILGDTVVEGNERLRLVLSNPSSGAVLASPNVAHLRIVDNDTAGTLAFSSTTYTGTEGGPAVVITVVRSGGAASGVTVQYATSNGSATAGSDYTPRSGTLSFGAGQTSRTFTVLILDDTAVESTETVNLTLRNPTGGATLRTPSTAALHILDNDSIVQFSAPTYAHGESAGLTSINVVRSGSLGTTATVRYEISGGTATAGADYTAAASGLLTFGPDVASRSVPITIVRDTLAEGPETINIVLSNPTAGMRLGPTSSAVLTIVDDDAAGRIAFSTSAYTAVEGGSAAVITVVRTGGAASGVTVRYATSSGTATAGADYVSQSGTLTFPAGATTATFTVPIVDNSTTESNETVRLILSNPTGGASLGSPATALLTIGDNEAVVEFTGTWVGTSFEVRRSGPVNGTVTVEYAATDGTAVGGVDYAPLAGTLTFGPGVTSRLIPVRIIADTIREGPETFTLFLRNPVGARLGGYNTRPMVIKDND